MHLWASLDLHVCLWRRVCVCVCVLVSVSDCECVRASVGVCGVSCLPPRPPGVSVELI